MEKTNHFNRRHFIKAVGATAVLLQIPFWQACTEPVYNDVLPRQDRETIYRVFNILFPPEPHPGIEQINAMYYLNNYLSDKRIDADEQRFIKNGSQWLNETAQENFQTDFLTLSADKQQLIIRQITEESWGESWLSKLLTLIFEALLLDPIYDVNTDEAGWKWLQHIPGIPRPNNKNKYPEILHRKHENSIITSLNQLEL